MALADTARLIVELALRDKLTGPLRSATRGVNQLDTNTNRLSASTTRLQTRSVALGVGLERLAEVGIRSVIGGIANGVAEMQRLEDANLQTAAAIESTGGVAGQSVEGIRAMAEAYESLNATVDDKAIQEAANVLLTFRRVGEEAFQPAIEAALNLSTALDQDLQTSIVQIGKALEDPIRGVTALRRAGVQLTEQQEEQIRTLVEQNDLYGAQQIILAELNKQVGGRFAAQGQGDAARAAALRDSLEDLQRVAAEGLAPGLTRVREALIGAFRDPQIIAGVRTVGENIANFLSAENLRTAGGLVKDVFGFLGSVPWGTIGDGLRIVGAGAKLAIDAFTALPKEVQGIVIAGLAANRLSGGIAGSLAVKGIEAILGGLKTIVAGNVTVIGPGAGVPGGGGGLGGALRGAATGAAVGLGVGAAAIAAVEVVNFENMRNESRRGLAAILDELPRTPEAIDESIARIQEQIDMERPLLEGVLFNTNVRPQLEEEIKELQQVKAAQERGNSAARDAIPWAIRNVNEIHNFNASEGRRFGTLWAKQDAAATLSRTGNFLAARTASATEATSRKNFSPVVKTNVNVNTTVKVSATIVKQQVDSVTQTTSVGGQTVL
jgi:hypothetical protein